MPFIQTAGPTVLLDVLAQSSVTTAGTTKEIGDWFQVHPKIGRLAFQSIMHPSSAGATLSATVWIEVSNDGVTPLSTKGFTFAQTGTTVQSEGGSFPTTLGGQWAYIRANANGISTSTAGSTGIGTVTVIVSGAPVAAGP